jgi:hypothetical protein
VLRLSAVTERLLDRETVGRVLRRASDLAGHEQEGLLHLGGISERALLEAAVEVGIPADAVHRALAMERLDPPPRHRAGDRLVGAAVIAVDAEVVGAAPDVLTCLDAWFVDGHHLRRDRLRDGRGVWTKRRGIVGRTVRTMRFATGEGRLGKVRRVSASTGSTGTGTTVLRIEVDQSRARQAAAAGAAAGGAAVVGTVVLAVLAGPVILLAAPIGLAAGVGAAAAARSHAGDVTREIDRVLDAVDEGVRPTRLRADIVRRVAGQTRVTRPSVSPVVSSLRRTGRR